VRFVLEADMGAEYPAVALFFRNSKEISRSGLSH